MTGGLSKGVRVERVRVGPDRRAVRGRPSHVARLFLWRLQARGLSVTLRRDGRVLVVPAADATTADRTTMVSAIHEIRDLLAERPA